MQDRFWNKYFLNGYIVLYNYHGKHLYFINHYCTIPALKLRARISFDIGIMGIGISVNRGY